jgi:hypothetical protein
VIFLLLCFTKPQLAISHLNYFITGTTEKKETHKTRDNKKIKMKRKWSVQKRYQVAS